jgi:CheY-like chemotaxis protein/anti-sigma regulatory factor (Ser/Thr protein kinase)
VLYDGGLLPAVQWLGRHVETSHGLRVTVSSGGGAFDVGENLRTFLFQAVRELLLNVVKHAAVGEAEVRLRQKEDWLQITVADRGAGFDRAALDAMQGARGFGVFSIEQRITVLGGSVRIDSSPGNGCRVTVRVPLETEEPASAEQQSRQPAEQPAAEPDPHNVRVLLVDDHAMVRQGFAMLFEETPGIELVGQACDGVEAVALARQLHPDVVTMDISMPRMDGVQATRIIKSELPRVRIIGLSMHDRMDMTDAMLAAGAEQYLPKDGPFESLRAAIMPV